MLIHYVLHITFDRPIILLVPGYRGGILTYFVSFLRIFRIHEDEILKRSPQNMALISLCPHTNATSRACEQSGNWSRTGWKSVEREWSGAWSRRLRSWNGAESGLHWLLRICTSF